MKLVFSDHKVPKNITKSIFLAGPSPREKDVSDWRHDAVKYLESIKFDGTVFLPVPKNRFYGDDDSTGWTYDEQVAWECECRALADINLFWVPRDIKGRMPAFATNIEFGEDLASGKIVYGRPATAEKCRYFDKRFIDMGLPFFETLEDTIDHAVSLLGDGAVRENGEVYVPLFIWKTPQFQSWYTNLKLAGNRLDHVKVLSHVTIRHTFTFCYIIKVNIWVEAEQRFKSNEVVFSRTDISSVVAYYKDADETYVAIVKEFRSPANNEQGFVFELAGGSAAKPGTDPLENVSHELHEEAGVLIEDLSRFSFVNKRQLVGTVSTHCSYLYKVELNKEEFEHILESAKNKTSFGEEGSSEITYVDMVPLSALKNSLVDFTTLGMIYESLF